MGLESLYSKKVMEHFKNPKNMGEIPLGPDVGVATVGNPICGDVMRLFVKVGVEPSGEKKKPEEYIKEAKFKTLGCGAAIATSSMATEMIKGRRLSEAEKLTNKAVAEALGGLPKVKMHCSVLAAEAVGKAIENYRRKKKNK